MEETENDNLHEKLGLKSKEDLIRNSEKLAKFLEDLNKNNLVFFPEETDGDIPPNQILAGAWDRLQEVVLVGVDNDGDYFMASSSGSKAEILWLLEKIKKECLFSE